MLTPEWQSLNLAVIERASLRMGQKPGVRGEIMENYNKRLHVLVTEEQFLHLKELSRNRRVGVGQLVREAIDQVYRPYSEINLRQQLNQLRDTAFIKRKDEKR